MSLLKLYRKNRAIDAFLDDRSNLDDLTVRAAWSEIVENVERGGLSCPPRRIQFRLLRRGAEANTHQVFLATLDAEIIAPLNSFKVCSAFYRPRFCA